MWTCSVCTKRSINTSHTVPHTRPGRRTTPRAVAGCTGIIRRHQPAHEPATAALMLRNGAPGRHSARTGAPSTHTATHRMRHTAGDTWNGVASGEQRHGDVLSPPRSPFNIFGRVSTALCGGGRCRGAAPRRLTVCMGRHGRGWVGESVLSGKGQASRGGEGRGSKYCGADCGGCFGFPEMCVKCQCGGLRRGSACGEMGVGGGLGNRQNGHLRSVAPAIMV